MNSIVCALCESEEELCQHLFVRCKHAWRVWTLCFKWIGILFVQHNDIATHFESFYLIINSRKQNLVLKGVWTAIVQCMWEHRNSVVFNDWMLNPWPCINSYK